MSKTQSKSIGIAGTKQYTADCINDLSREGVSIDYLIALTPEQANTYTVAGYADLSPVADALDIELYHPETYGLSSPADQNAVEEMELDVLLVAGWSRLIPGSILESLHIGALGCHGSPEGLPKGRGRAVLNWALIEGETKFSISLLLLDAGADSGRIVETKEFDVTNFDTASTLRYKTWMAYTSMLIDNFSGLISGEVNTRSQDDDEATYYPKREPGDGAIDWQQSASSIHRLVRALTKPYPGAFTFLNTNKLFVWEAIPFDRTMNLGTGEPGRVCKVFHAGELLVETGDIPLLITEHEGIDPDTISVGDVFESVEIEKTLSTIRTRYPDSVDHDQREI